mmetsp:Transcript_59872/g.165658  ORF Transcript_59872/g.165658 Transcript_59872/m.165658 type:complete len:326 (+) Transcript_59872:245-1222(+)
MLWRLSSFREPAGLPFIAVAPSRPLSANSSFVLICSTHSFRSFKFCSSTPSKIPSPLLEAALTSFSALDTSCSARSEIARTSRKPVNLPAPASVCGSVAASSTRLLTAILRPSSPALSPLLPKSPCRRDRMSFSCPSTCCLSCMAWVSCSESRRFSLSQASRCSKNCNLLRLLDSLKWSISLSCVSRALFDTWISPLGPALPPTTSLRLTSSVLTTSDNAMSCWSQIVSSRPMRWSSVRHRSWSFLILWMISPISFFRFLRSLLRVFSSSDSSEASTRLLEPCFSKVTDLITWVSCVDRFFSVLIVPMRSSCSFFCPIVQANWSL